MVLDAQEAWSLGHLAYVTAVSGNTITIRHSNVAYLGTGVCPRTDNATIIPGSPTQVRIAGGNARFLRGFLSKASVDTAPSIAITSPTSNPTYSTSSSTVNLGGSASDNVGVVLVAWANNRGGGGSASGTTTWSANNITLYSGENVITVSAIDAAGNFTPDTITVTRTSSGSIRVSIVPPEAASAGAQWRIVGESEWQNSGAIRSGLALGTYQVEFKPITGWTTPPRKSVPIDVVTPDIWIDSDPYVRPLGSIRVSIVPPEAASAGAQWRIVGEGEWQNSGAIRSGLALGTYQVEFKPITGWTTPPRKSVPIDVVTPDIWIDSDPYVRPLGSIRVSIVPPEAASAGAQWRIVGENEWQNSGAIRSGLPLGTYQVEFKPITGWTTPPTKSVPIDVVTPDIWIDSDAYVQLSGITVTASDATAGEPDSSQGTGTFTFSRTGPTAAALTVNITVGGGTATSGSDYTSIGATVTFAAGSATATKTVSVLDDNIPEADETVMVTLASGSGYTVGSPATATVTIIDDNLPVITVTASDATAGEPGSGQGTGIFTFSRTGLTAVALTVNFTVGGTATSGSDYSSIGTTVAFAAGSATVTKTVSVLEDNIPEADETVMVTLASGSGYMAGSPATATVTIINDDLPVIAVTASDATAGEPGSGQGAGTFTFSRTGLAAVALTVNFTVGGTATSGSDYTSIGATVAFAAGSATATKTVSVLDDNIPEADETVMVTLASGSGYAVGSPATATVTITDDDPVGEVTAAQTVSGGYHSPGSVTVNCQLSYPSGRSLLSLNWRPTLPAGWNVSSVAGDGAPEFRGGEIVFVGSSLTANPINLSYIVSVPAGESGNKELAAAVEYQLNGMVNPLMIQATPNPLRLTPVIYHTADYRDARWQIDGTEVNRVLSYWRAGGHHADAAGLDGFAPGTGDTSGTRHMADYRALYWVIDGTEVNRVLSYWRAGAYHADAAGLDGFAPGTAAGTSVAALQHQLSAATVNTITQSGPANYTAGSNIQITNRFNYSGTLLSLLLRPQLPSGWALSSATGNGTVEIQNAEIVLLGSLPPNLVEVVMTVQVPAGQNGVKNVRTEVEYQFSGETNPASSYAAPDPLAISDDVPQSRLIRLAGDLSFGNVGVGTTSNRNLTIFNDGNATLSVSDINYPAGFSGAWSGTIPAGTSLPVTVIFNPTSATNYGGNLIVNSDATNPGANALAVSGSGTSAGPTEVLVLKQWEQTFGGSEDDEVFDVQQTSDGGYVMIGYSRSGVSGNKTVAGYGERDCWIVKTDALGNKQWERVYGGSGDDGGLSIRQTGDGGYIWLAWSASGISGNKSSAGFGSYDFWLVKLDSNGDKLWEKVFGGTSDDQATVLWQTSDGGCILGGGSASGVSGNKTSASFGSGDIWIVKVDANGNKQWEANFGGNDNDAMYPHNGGLKQTSDGGFILAGHSRSPISGNKTKAGFGGDDFWLVKIDASGGKQWDQVFGGSGMDGSPAVDATSDGGYIIGGISPSPVSGNKTAIGFGGDDGWLIKTDGNGNKQWEQVFGGTGSDYLFSLRQVGDGGYLLGLFSTSGVSGNKTTPSFGGGDYWVIKIDGNGAKQWERAFGGSGGDGYRTAFKVTSDGGLILGTQSESGVSGNKTTPGFGQSDYWLVKLITIDGALDTDGDGHTDFQEFIAGTDPLNPASALRITAIREVGSDVQLDFASIAGKMYRVESKNSLSDATWTQIDSFTSAVTGTQTVVDTGAGAGASQFYRVKGGPNGEVVTDPAGYYGVTLNAGANAISVPLHNFGAGRLVSSVSGSTVTVSGSPGWTANALAPQNGFSQYIVLVRKDASASPGIEGDWWTVASNTGNTLTLNAGTDVLSSLLDSGDQIKVRRLTSMKDLFGTGTTLILNKDSNGNAASGSFANADVIRFISGTSFGQPIFYHDGTILAAGYYAQGGNAGPLDGSTITALPGQGFMVFRKTGSSPTTVLVNGQVQVSRLTEYLKVGPNVIGSPFAGAAPIGTSNLKESGWVSDRDGSAAAGDFSKASLLRLITGTSFGPSVFHHDGSILQPAGWYDANGVLNNSFPLQPGKAYIFFITEPNPVRWRQAVPYVP
ncbi:MAG: TIGR02597 family protein [Verrucomicrobiota bacterium]